MFALPTRGDGLKFGALLPPPAPTYASPYQFKPLVPLKC